MTSANVVIHMPPLHTQASARHLDELQTRLAGQEWEGRWSNPDGQTEVLFCLNNEDIWITMTLWLHRLSSGGTACSHRQIILHDSMWDSIGNLIMKYCLSSIYACSTSFYFIQVKGTIFALQCNAVHTLQQTLYLSHYHINITLPSTV